MSSNLDSDRLVSAKMHPIDLAPQKITIVKSVSNTDVKMAHLVPGQPKTTASNQVIAHASPATNLIRSGRGLAQIISTNVASQPQMIISSSILQGTQIVSQSSQIIGQNTIMSQSQLLPSGPILSPGTQIISQGTQLSAPVSCSNIGLGAQTSVASPISGSQVLNVGGQLVSGAGNLVVNSSVRTLPPTVRVLPPLPHHNTRPAVLSSVNVSGTSGVLVNKGLGVGVTSHVPRGLAAGASLAVRPVTPSINTQSNSAQGGTWSGTHGPRSTVVYGQRGTRPTTPTPLPVQPTQQSPSALPPASVLSTTGVISNTNRVPPRAPTPTPVTGAPRPLPLLQRNYQPAKVVGVSSVGPRGVVGNSAPAQLYYEVPRAHAPAPLTSYAHHTQLPHSQVSVVNTVPSSPDSRVPATTSLSQPVLPRPSILRKRDIEGSPTKSMGYVRSEGTGWEDVPGGGGGGGGGASGGSTTISASSSPAPDDEPEPEPVHRHEVSPRKKPRKQMYETEAAKTQRCVTRTSTLNNEVRQCDYQDEPRPSPPPITFNPPPKRPLLSSSYVCGWRSTALHFARPGDVRRREPRARDIAAIASQKHVLAAADGWKVHHLTAQMDDLMSLESDVGEQMANLLRALETASGRTISALQPHSHSLLELLKGNIQRSKIVCEGIQEAREDILRVFTHRNFVSDILIRQADKRSSRKHRSQS